MKGAVIDWIIKYKVVAIARCVDSSSMVDLAKALYEGGIRTLEITFNQASDTGVTDTSKSIAIVKQHMGDKICVGAGTVMTVRQAQAAREAGADFALAPNVRQAVIERIKALGMVAVPGALTPSEIADAYGYGADIVKLFPAGNFGIEYVKAIRGPLNHIPLMAVGGVNLENIKSFLNNGFTSVGIGSNIVKNSLINAGRFEEIIKLAQAYTDSIY